MSTSSPSAGTRIRRWSRTIHRDLSYFFSGVIVIYAVSGISLNHKRDFNPDYNITRQEVQIEDAFPQQEEAGKETIDAYLSQVGESIGSYTRHYYFGNNRMKVFLKGGSSIEVDMNTGGAVYEKVRKRPVLKAFNRLHYNPSRWWTWFSDIFAVCLLVIVVTGLVMVKGNKGLWGRGGIELLAGFLVPLLFMLFIK